jgi:hypothetical protein
MCNPTRKLERGAGRFDEGTSGIGEFHGPSRIASEEVNSLLFFEVGNLLAEGRLGDVQSIRGPREVALFRQNNDRVHMTYINVGEHCSHPVPEFGHDRIFVLPFVYKTNE